MDAIAVLAEACSRIPDQARRAVDGLTPAQLATPPAQLATPPAPGANTVGWLVWHLARGQDAQVAEVAGTEQVYRAGDWAPRFGLEPDDDDTGYGHGPDQVRAVRPESADALLGYLDAVHAWEPPVTLGARLVSIIDDDVQHAGQAAYARGLLGA